MATSKTNPSKVASFVDGNWLLHRTFRTKGQSSSVPERTVPLQILNYCCVYALQLGAAHGALTFDGGDNYRLKVYPKYKASRRGGVSASSSDYGESYEDDEFKDLLYRCLIPTVKLFRMVGFPVHQDPSFEADDLVAAGANHFSETVENSLSWIVCRDKDAFQAVRQGRIHVYWPEVGTNPAMRMDEAAVQKKVGMPPKTFGDYQILVGDATDDVPPILKSAAAKKILKQHSTLSNYFRTKEGQVFFRRYHEELVRNLKLVRMDLRSWKPSASALSLDKIADSRTVLSEFGKLPKSFYALKSALASSRRSLF